MNADENTLTNFTEQYRPQIEQTLATIVQQEASQPTLQQSEAYSLLAGGKRLRPLLTLATLRSLGQPILHAQLVASTAVELVHTYSLIHDDLPAMDDSDLRRGKAASHKRFGEAQAILAGDGLLTDAFAVLSKCGLPAEQTTALVGQLATAAGSHGMVAGQMLDIEATGTSLALDDLRTLDRQKTGALFYYSVMAGAIMGQATDPQQRSLAQFAWNFGVAFQIYDDLQDEQVGTNEDAGKNSYVQLLGRPAATQVLAETVAAGAAAVAELEHPELLRAFLTYFKG
ncbi:polyprenyl synthetase family protein [Fructilactobacillus myrtifloralis]|uniref:Polyprenyl synthetase family protein n=1 Tax=Fructilactobacillus myrtifloralis TaxID=2940301 RepID=A0ABY5BPV3_9LACO|nr:polyprenyl synthetase family protein [Fructilactobacillus myrtifloralis]USS85285.1 polyprenyl synthetase family protein [Fructilactobacillus myrtifloralis]